jgi:hypothetical protein
VLLSEKAERREDEDCYVPELRLVYAPRGETSGHLKFPLRALSTVAGRSMLGGLKLLLDSFRLFADAVAASCLTRISFPFSRAAPSWPIRPACLISLTAAACAFSKV